MNLKRTPIWHTVHPYVGLFAITLIGLGVGYLLGEAFIHRRGQR